MQVTVKYRGQLAALTKIAVEQIDAAAVKDILRHIKNNFGGEAEKTAKTMLIAVNGESILHREHYKTILQNGDEVSFLPICGGG
jgi:molybdopterin converting factor small subunit